MKEQQRTAAIWGLGGFILGAIFSGAVIEGRGHSSAEISSASVKSQADMPKANTESNESRPQRLMLFAVKSDEMDGAIETMDLPPREQRAFRTDVENHKFRLLWLTLWDWDSPTTRGDTISITSDNYHRLFALHDRRSKIAIPEPKSGMIEIRGERTENAITVSLLSGAQPLALPPMAVGQTVKIEVDTP